MKTTRTRMLVVFITAAVIISFFMHWDDVVSGFRSGYYSDASYSRTK
jgi:hypothetical protein